MHDEDARIIDDAVAALDDIAAEIVSAATPGARDGLQFEQGLIKNTYVKASEANAGWEILIEEG